MSVLDGPGDGTWSVFAEKCVSERDEALYRIAVLTAENAALREEIEDAREAAHLRGIVTVNAVGEPMSLVLVIGNIMHELLGKRGALRDSLTVNARLLEQVKALKADLVALKP